MDGCRRVRTARSAGSSSCSADIHALPICATSLSLAIAASRYPLESPAYISSTVMPRSIRILVAVLARPGLEQQHPRVAGEAGELDHRRLEGRIVEDRLEALALDHDHVELLREQRCERRVGEVIDTRAARGRERIGGQRRVRGVGQRRHRPGRSLAKV